MIETIILLLVVFSVLHTTQQLRTNENGGFSLIRRQTREAQGLFTDE